MTWIKFALVILAALMLMDGSRVSCFVPHEHVFAGFACVDHIELPR